MTDLLEAFGVRHLADDPTVWRPHALNVFTAAADQVRRDGDRTWVGLVDSRWEGCRIRVWSDRVEVAGQTATVTLRDNDWPLVLTDGRYTDRVPAREIWEDRRNPEPHLRHVITPRWHQGFNNSVIVPAVDLTAMDDYFRIALTRSRWEGLYFTAPAFRVELLGVDEARVTFGKQHPLVRVHGGAARMTVPAQEIWQDRLTPLPEPGPSLAVHREPWVSLEVAAHHVRLVDTKHGRRCVLTVPRRASEHPRARMWLAAGLVKPCEPHLYTVRLPAGREVTLHLHGGGTAVLTVPEFVEWAQEWALMWPRRTRGVETIEPDYMPPAEGVVVPDELLDE